jgi:hypothetical protein
MTSRRSSHFLDDMAIPKKTYWSRDSDDGEIPLDALDPDTSRLLPTKKRRLHHVWVQGKLAPVRSVSIANMHGAVTAANRSSAASVKSPVLLAPPTAGGSSGARSPARSPRFDPGVGSAVSRKLPRRRRSFDDGDDDEESDECERVRARDTQLRGYGIGGAGNISTLPFVSSEREKESIFLSKRSKRSRS